MSPLKYTVLDLDFPAGQKNKTAVLVEGEREAMVFDAAFTRADGHRIVAEVLDSGKALTKIIVSAGDPDYYFGLEVLADAFPNAAILATPIVVDYIHSTYESKLVTWAASGVNLPTRLVDMTLLNGDLDFEGHRFELKGGDPEIPDRHWFFEPESRVILGGVLLCQDQHVWVADTPNLNQRQAWIRALDEMTAQRPTIAYPGHRIPHGSLDCAAISWTRDYLVAFNEILGDSASGSEATERLIARYPDAGLIFAARLSSEVAMGEVEWH